MTAALRDVRITDGWTEIRSGHVRRNRGLFWIQNLERCADLRDRCMRLMKRPCITSFVVDVRIDGGSFFTGRPVRMTHVLLRRNIIGKSRKMALQATVSNFAETPVFSRQIYILKLWGDTP